MPIADTNGSMTYDSNAILDQVDLHRKIADYYDRALQAIHDRGSALANQMANWIPDDATTYTSQWLQPTVEDVLKRERDAHRAVADKLEAFADEVVMHERRLRTYQD